VEVLGWFYAAVGFYSEGYIANATFMVSRVALAATYLACSGVLGRHCRCEFRSHPVG